MGASFACGAEIASGSSSVLALLGRGQEADGVRRPARAVLRGSRHVRRRTACRKHLSARPRRRSICRRFVTRMRNRLDVGCGRRSSSALRTLAEARRREGGHLDSRHPAGDDGANGQPRTLRDAGAPGSRIGCSRRMDRLIRFFDERARKHGSTELICVRVSCASVARTSMNRRDFIKTVGATALASGRAVSRARGLRLHRRRRRVAGCVRRQPADGQSRRARVAARGRRAGQRRPGDHHAGTLAVAPSDRSATGDTPPSPRRG